MSTVDDDDDDEEKYNFHEFCKLAGNSIKIYFIAI